MKKCTDAVINQISITYESFYRDNINTQTKIDRVGQLLLFCEAFLALLKAEEIELLSRLGFELSQMEQD